MDLDSWTTDNKADTARQRRLTMGYAIGAVTVTAALSFVTYSTHGKVFEPDDTIDVELAKAPVIEAEPEPEPPPKVQKKKKKKKRKRRTSAGPPPKEIPDNVPAEANPSDNPYDGDLDDVFDGDDAGRAVVVAKKKKAPRKKARVRDNRPARVSFVSEAAKTTRAVPTDRIRPRWSRGSVLQAHESGVSSVLLRCVVQTDGSVTRCRVLNGHPALNGAAIDAASNWRFRPGTFDGRPQAQWVTLPFRIEIRS